MVPPGIGQVKGITGKASALNHLWPEKIDYPNPESNSCCFVMYAKCNLTGHYWSGRPAFITILYLE